MNFVDKRNNLLKKRSIFSRRIYPKKHLRDQLVLQTCELIGGPCEYDGKTMLESHTGLNIKEREFYILVEYVQGAMRDVGLTYQQENRILKLLAPIKYETVGL